MKRASSEPGSVAVYACKRGVGYPDKREGWVNIPAWSRGAAPWKNLSPFFMGPIEGCSNFESWWQFHKVWENVNGERHIGEDGLPNEAWYAWQKKGYANPTAIRRPNGWQKPLYAWHQGQKLGVVEARKQLYIPELQKLYRAHPTYQALLKLVRGGQSVIIIEPDGPADDVRCNPLSKETLVALQSCTTWREAGPHFGHPEWVHRHSNRYFPYGHGYVIALTILEDLEN
jgi:hypothetical protein